MLGAIVKYNFLLSRNFIYYLFYWVGPTCLVGLSSVVASRIYSLVAVLGALAAPCGGFLGEHGSRARSLH